MNFDYYTTRIDGLGSSPVGDTLLTPLRWLVNGKEYKIKRIIADVDGISDVYKPPKEAKITRVVKRIIGLLGTLTLVPVLVGLIIKAFTINRYSIKNYAIVKKVQKGEITFTHLCREKISRAPKKVEPTEQELISIKGKQKGFFNKVLVFLKIKTKEDVLDELLVLWDANCRGREDYASIRKDLSLWITQVKDPNQYNHIPRNLVADAAADLQQTLRLIVVSLKNAKPEEVERVLIALRDASVVCSPTWIEVAKKEYTKLKGGGGLEDKILHYVQRTKEDLLLDYTNKLGYQWHLENYIKSIIGDEIGLDKSLSRYDDVVEKVDRRRFSREECLGIFNNIYTQEKLIASIVEKIRLDKPITDDCNGLDYELASYLDDRADLCAQKEGVDISATEYSSAMYVINNFYDKKTEKGREIYFINEKGVTQLLIKSGILTEEEITIH